MKSSESKIMPASAKYENQKHFWERAGAIGYGEAVFANKTVEKHIVSKQWETVAHTAEALGLGKNSSVLELGCGDGEFALNVLSGIFKHVDAYEVSAAAVARAQANTKSSNINFQVKDLATYNYEANSHWDGAFLVGFLHHVKSFTQDIIARLSRVSSTVVVLEPNGDNLIRKSLELLPSYRAAGEDSFHLKTLVEIFRSNGYTLKVLKKINFVPQFCPEFLYPVLRSLEKTIETNPVFDRLCSTYVLGFQK